MYCDINVVEKEQDGRYIKVLLIDEKEESATFMGVDKYELVYPYNIKIFSIMEGYDTSSILLLGGGGFSIPKYFISHYPKGRIDVVEKESIIFKIAKEEFYVSDLISQYGLDGDNSRMMVYINDAIEFLRSSKYQYSVIINDVYNGGEMVSEILTEESVKLIVDHICKNGIYIINFFSAVCGK